MNYGSTEHKRSECKENQPKCFKCSNIGHIAKNCPDLKVKKNVNIVMNKRPLKVIKRSSRW